MMKASEAYSIVDKGRPLLECSDFGDFYGFVFGKEGEPIGTGYTCVDKKTGRVFGFAPFDDFDLFRKSVQIPLKEVTNGR